MADGSFRLKEDRNGVEENKEEEEEVVEERGRRKGGSVSDLRREGSEERYI